MTYTALSIKERKLTLPDEWVNALNTDQVAAGMFGDVLVIRPIETVEYSPEAEKRVLDAVTAFEVAERKGETFELGGKTFDDLMNEAKSVS